MPVGRAAKTIVGAGGKTKQSARRPYGYLAPFRARSHVAPGPPDVHSAPKGGMPRVAAECAMVRPIKFGDIVTVRQITVATK